MDQAWFCREVAQTNKLELLKWAREVKHCEWDEETINAVACEGNLEAAQVLLLRGGARTMKKLCAFVLLSEDASTVFDFFSTKWNLRERRKKKW